MNFIGIIHLKFSLHKAFHIQFYNESLDLVWDNPDVVNAQLTSDEAYFHLSNYVNRQNFWYWAQK
jgi:hypothetical protein